MIFLDLDGFKPVNDQYGHAAGDRVLIEVAHRLEQIAGRRSDLVARLGGDEFVILCEGHHSDRRRTDRRADPRRAHHPNRHRP